jgi:hypothetical protein
MLRLLLLVTWIAQVALALIFVDASWIQGQIAAEQDRIVIHLGADRAGRLQSEARAIFDEAFMTTGIVGRSYAMLLPNPAVPKQGMDNVAPWFFSWVETRLDVVWWVAFQLILRALLLREWLTLVIVGVTVAMLDGHIQQRIKRGNSELASADLYLIARQAALLSVVFPAFYVVLPATAPPWLVPAWGLYSAITCRWLLAHAQHRL